MDSRLILVSLLIVFIQFNSATWASTNTDDGRLLKFLHPLSALDSSSPVRLEGVWFWTTALKSLLKNLPFTWVGADPCVNGWEGIGCSNGRVISITLASMDLKGELSEDFQGLSELKILDLSYNKGLTGNIPASIGSLKSLTNLILMGCSFSGQIPDTIGSLTNLVVLSLNSNSFSGVIPPSIGNLYNLNWLDITENQITGTIPISNGGTPGLDMLTQMKHFHFGKNRLSGPIPPQLFSSKMTMIHLLLDNNHLTGSIPPTLGLATTLEIIRLDRNLLSGPVPSNLNNLTSLTELLLSNNNLTGTVPNLTGMNHLSYLDMSQNNFEVSDFPSWFSTLLSLTTLTMEFTKLTGDIPVALFSLPQYRLCKYQLNLDIAEPTHISSYHENYDHKLIALPCGDRKLRNNQITGTLEFGSAYNSHLRLVDLQKNYISEFKPGLEYEFKIILVGNPMCQDEGNEKYCTPAQPNSSYSTQPKHSCIIPFCSSDLILGPNCSCAYPYIGTLVFRAPSFSNSGDSSDYKSIEQFLMQLFRSLQLPVDTVSLSNSTMVDDYLKVNLKVFPQGQDRFNRTGIFLVGFALSNQTSAFSFIADPYQHFEGTFTPGAKKSSNTGIIVGATTGGSFLALLLLFAGVYAFSQKRRAERATKQSNPFAKWDQRKGSGGIPQLKGARQFTFEEIKKCTNNFSEANNVGSGGYGKVYRGILPTGQMVAIKRAKQESMQGGLEFKTELELLSRVHHKNVVGLVGFCFEHGEQMLVYEFVPNGSLKESLSGKSGIRLDWRKRLKVALCSARGLAYLHELAEPPSSIGTSNQTTFYWMNA
ncbi:putative leucine-rich repeat receptor-like protein kinase [Vitis vinifera]|uniref:Putative leucine-rich repeat receptor-like protein kinase n=1 Tax=Vitis vinifera TaxID=29760 RepID=A0A438E989_VITVI|nr:putative leucine-rich repeat receptor-like protein kinase [Vitis vinifera]